MMRQLSIALTVDGATIYQTIILEDDEIKVSDFISGLNKKEYFTTVGHDRCFDDENYVDVEVLDKNLKRVGYVKEQYVDDYAVLENFELIDSIDLND